MIGTLKVSKTVQVCLGDILNDFPWIDICDSCHNLYPLTFSFTPIEDFLELLDLKLGNDLIQDSHFSC